MSETFVCDIYAQVIYTMKNNECYGGEDASLTPDTTDDSCITQFIEIVPLYIPRKDFPNAVQVKDEFTVDIKQEPEDLCEVDGTSGVNVRLFVCFFLILKIAVFFNLINYCFLVLIISFFTAQSSYASAVLESQFCPSVRHTRALWQNKRTYSWNFAITWKRSQSSFWHQKRLVGDVPFHQKFAPKVTHPRLKNADFDQYLLITFQPYKLATDVQL